MQTSSLVGLVIGICFVTVAIIIRIVPVNNKWLFTMYTSNQKAKAIHYISRLLLLLGSLFCLVALLPLMSNFRGLRTASFVTLAILSMGLVGRLTKKHVGPGSIKNQLSAGSTSNSAI